MTYMRYKKDSAANPPVRKRGYKRRPPEECTRMPRALTEGFIAEVHRWPVRPSKLAQACAEGWTDCVIHLIDNIRLGDKYNSRRVRYDGFFYVSYRGRRVYIQGEAVWIIHDTMSKVYKST